jgi:hypothetical protein
LSGDLTIKQGVGLREADNTQQSGLKNRQATGYSNRSSLDMTEAREITNDVDHWLL